MDVGGRECLEHILEESEATLFAAMIYVVYKEQKPVRPWTSVAYMDVGKGREQERKLTPLRGMDDRVYVPYKP